MLHYSPSTCVGREGGEARVPLCGCCHEEPIRTSAPKNRRGRRFGGNARALDGKLGMLGRANDEIVSNDKRLSSPVRVVAFLSPMDWKLGWKIEERNCAVLELLVTELLAGTVSPAGGDEFLSGLLSTLRPDTLKIAGRSPIYCFTGPWLGSDRGGGGGGVGLASRRVWLAHPPTHPLTCPLGRSQRFALLLLRLKSNAMLPACAPELHWESTLRSPHIHIPPTKDGRTKVLTVHHSPETRIAISPTCQPALQTNS